VGGEVVNPLANVAVHAAVKGQLEQDPLVRAAFEKMVATGTSAHHAEHVLGVLLLETEWETARGVEAGKDPEKALEDLHRQTSKARSGFSLSQETHWTVQRRSFCI
jgi:hypothetical protein